MQRLSESQRLFLREATLHYHASLPGSPAEEHLETRGLTAPSIRDEVDRFLIGYVADPLPGHEMYRGKLVIPYLRWSQEYGWAVVSLRFRCIADHDHKGHKYLTVAGDRPRLYNTLALLRDSRDIAITEGEFDAIAAQLCGVPAVGVPGTQTWKPYFREPFVGYRTVYVLADGDEAGMQFAEHVAGKLHNAKIIPMPPKEDVNSLVMREGKGALLERMKWRAK